MSTQAPTAHDATQAASADGQPSKALVPAQPQAPARLPVEYDPDDPVSLYMNTGIFEQLQRVARMMASSALVPAHLRTIRERDGDKERVIDRTADCFLVAAQAFRWRMDPFAAAQHTFVTSGKLGYEGKLIAAVINSSAKLERNLAYVYSGDKGTPGRTVTVLGLLRGENEPRSVEGSVSNWQTQNEKWKSMPDQMLAYRGAREWARRHMPEAVLGIQAEEEVQEAVTLTPDRNGRYVAPRNLEARTDKLEVAAPAEHVGGVAGGEDKYGAEAGLRAPAAGTLHPDHPDAEREPESVGKVLAETVGKDVESDADPTTPAGNPFLRGAEKARISRKGQGSLPE
jgi:hypothetical protein